MQLSWLEQIHYVRLPLIVTSGSLAIVSSMVLTNEFIWEMILLVMLGTYIVYTLDNLLDWQREKHLLKNFNKFYEEYKRFSIWGMLFCLMIAIFILINSWADLSLVGLISIYLVGFLIILISRITVQLPIESGRYWIERLIVSMSWAIITVLVPLQLSGTVNIHATILTLLYVWQIAWVIGVMWRFANVQYLIITNDIIESASLTVTGNHRFVMYLKLACISAFLQAIVDILLGFFPLYNIVVISVPMILYILLNRWEIILKHPLTYCNISLLFVNISMLFVIYIYISIT